MKIKYIGPIETEDLFQALFQDRKLIFGEHNIGLIRSATLYFTPVNELGEIVTITGSDGRPIEGCISAGAYFSAASQYDRQPVIEPKIVTRGPLLRP